MDDIDDFLDEVESKYCGNEPTKDKGKKTPSKEKTTVGKTKPSVPSSSIDDLDTLIDDIISDDSKKTKMTKPPTTQKQTQQPRKSKPRDDLDNMIDDIMADDGLDNLLRDNTGPSLGKPQHQPQPQQHEKQHEKQQFSGQKCSALYVNGPQGEFGVATSTNRRSCDRLHCTACDNRVVVFPNFKWDESCDYLHFRNNYPDFERLKSKMWPGKGHQAYCCQCSWLAVDQVKELKACFPSLKWICRKH